MVENPDPDMTGVLGIVSFRVFPTHMGGQKGVALFYRYLQQHMEVFLAASYDNRDSKGLPIERILFPNKRMYRNIFKIKDLVFLSTEKKTDIIIAEHSYTAWLAWLVQKKTGKPFIIHSHNIESRRFKKMGKWWWRIYHGYEARIHRNAQHNFFISDEDREFAIKNFGLQPHRCSVVTYGIETKPGYTDRVLCRKKAGIDKEKIILLFNGTLDYEPNSDAVVTLIDKIEPLLNKKLSNFQIIITGNRARKELIQKIISNPNVHYAGYVEDVNLYYQCADLFINPVLNDTGVKTKLIEAIANNCTTISTDSGATGIKKEICGDKLITVPDENWNSFAEKILDRLHSDATTPEAFYEYYHWENIAERAATIIENILEQNAKSS